MAKEMVYSPTPGKVSVTGLEFTQGRQSMPESPEGPYGPPKSHFSLRCSVFPFSRHTFSETFQRSTVFSGQHNTKAEASMTGLSRSQMLM